MKKDLRGMIGKGGFAQYSVFVRFLCVQKTHPLFCTYVYGNSIRVSVFFVVRTTAHHQILDTHRVGHGSTFVRFRTYQ